MWYDRLLEKDLVPDFLIRKGIRGLLAKRLRDEDKGNPEANLQALMKLIEDLKKSPIAVDTTAANEQHYEVPAEFYEYCLGKHLKYSSGYWKEGVTDLDTSEQDMLELTCERAELKPGQDVMELGCGWGSLSLFMSSRFPESRFMVISNSKSQKIYIDKQAALRNIRNLTVVTADMNTFQTEQTFDRIISVEMFEHMRNYELLLHKIAGWMKPEAKLFVHIFTHHKLAYKFEVKDESDWMSKHFFSGGIMPSNKLLLFFNKDVSLQLHWMLNGMHYSKTSEAWLRNMDAHRKEIMHLFENTYGKKNALKWWVYWRIFYLACAELWGYKNGNEWMVSHYLFTKHHT